MTESELLGDVPDGLLIAGEWVAASGGGTLAVHDPSTGAVIKQIADAKNKLASMPPGPERDRLAAATERFELNNTGVEEARLAQHIPRHWIRVGVIVYGNGMTAYFFWSAYFA